MLTAEALKKSNRRAFGDTAGDLAGEQFVIHRLPCQLLLGNTDENMKLMPAWCRDPDLHCVQVLQGCCETWQITAQHATQSAVSVPQARLPLAQSSVTARSIRKSSGLPVMNQGPVILECH